jgi:hypothetical protein
MIKDWKNIFTRMSGGTVMNFVYEDPKNLLNYTRCTDINPSGIRRFSSSAAAGKMISSGLVKILDLKSKPSNFIIPTGVNHSPYDWAKTSSLAHLSEEYLRYVRKGKAMLMFDQTLEGYQTPWLWKYFHDDCVQHNINPSSIIYITGNLLAESQYTKWASDNKIENQLNVISYALFESDVYGIAEEMNLKNNFQHYLSYKKENASDIKSFDCLQKRLRAHRMWIYQKLYDSGLTNEGLISMNPFNSYHSYFEGKMLDPLKAEQSNKILPLLVNGKNNNEFDDNYYIRRITKDVYMNSWVSLISEASFADSDETIFLSEKTFKPIACMQPFIIAGNKNSLMKLKQRGYKTFEGFIDESYDDLPTFERLEAVVESVKRITKIKDKVEWYESMQDILIHNYQVLQANSRKLDTALLKVTDCYNRYFKR